VEKNDNRNYNTSGDLHKMSYLFQRLSVIIRRFHLVLIHESFVSADEEPFQLLILA